MNPQKWFRLSGSIASAIVLLLVSNACLMTGISAQSAESGTAGSSISGTAPVPFVIAPSLALSGSPTNVATGDLNQDGKLDLVTTDSITGKVTVFLGAGNGKFASGVDYTTGSHPGAVVVADLDASGQPEVVVGDESKGTISILTSNGTGTLLPKQTLALGFDPAFFAAGDFNGDGRTDLVVTSRTGGSLAVLLNDGKGNLQKPILTSLIKTPTAITVADFNNDDHTDIALANADGTVTILLGTGSGGFRALADVPVGSGSLSSIVSGDFNRDGNLDLAVTEPGAKTLSVLLGKGNGSFASPAKYPVGTGPIFTIAADVDGDGIPDLVAVNSGSNTFSVFSGNGDGTFKTSVDFVVGNSPLAAVSGDFDGDGHLDLAVINSLSQSVSIALGNGDGTFKAARSYPSGMQPRAVTSADLNGDKLPDLVVTNYCGSDSTCSSGGSVTVFLANKDGSYQPSDTYPVGFGPVSVALVDVNGDKIPDIVALNRQDKTVAVLIGKGEGSFEQPFTASVTSAPIAVGVGDFNNDGKPDLAVLEDCGSAKCTEAGSVEILLGQGGGSFSNSAIYPVGYSPVSLAVGDLNNDKSLDIVVANGCGIDVSCKSSGTASVLLGSQTGKFKAAADVPAGNNPSSIALEDLSGQGTLDLLVSSSSANTVAVLRGKGDGSFQNSVPYAVGNAPGSMVIADFNGDGKLDVAVANTQDSTVSVLYGKGDGTLAASFAMPVGTGPEALAAVTSTNSSRASLATANGNTGSATLGKDVTVLANVMPETPTSGVTVSLVVTPPTTLAVNQAFVLQATVSPVGSPAGTVSFYSANNGGVATLIPDCSATTALNSGGVASCTTSSFLTGTDSITAVYSGDTTNPGNTPSNAVSETVNPESASLSVGSSSGTINVDQSVTFTATLSAGSNPLTPIAPTGTVSFTVNNVAIAGCTSVARNSGGTWTCTTSSLAGSATAESVGVAYAGDSNYSVTAVSFSQTVNALPATLGLTSSAVAPTVDQAVTFTANLSAATLTPVLPSGTVSFTINKVPSTDCPPQTIKLVSSSWTASCTTSSLVAPADVIGAIYNGDSSYTVSTQPTLAQTVNKALPQVTVASSLPTSSVNQTVVFTATVQLSDNANPKVTPSGTITFMQGSTTLCSAVSLSTTSPYIATCSYAFSQAIPSPGASVSATYSGDSNFQAGSAATATQIVSPTNTRTTLSSSPATSSVNGTVVFTATITPAITGTASPQTGTVVYTDTTTSPATVLCTNTVTGGVVPTCSYAFTSAGTHIITAIFNSTDANFNSSPVSAGYAQSVLAAGTTISLTSLPTSSAVNQSVTFSSVVTSASAGAAFPQGMVTYTDTFTTPSTLLCTVTLTGTGNVPSCTATLPTAGTHTIVAAFTPSNLNFQSARSSVLNQVVNAGTTAVALTTSPSTSTVNQLVTLTATITPTPSGATNPTGKVTFSYVQGGSTVVLCSTAQTVKTTAGITSATCIAPFTAANTYTVTATYVSGDLNFTAGTPVTATQKVTGTSTTVAISTLTPAPSAVNQSVSFTAVVTPSVTDSGLTLPTGTVTFSDTTSGKPILLCTSTIASNGTVPACSAPFATEGMRSVTAVYSGDTNFTGNTSAAVTQNVQPSGTTTMLISSPASSTVNQTVIFTATLGEAFPGSVLPKAGTVVFTDTSTTPATTLCSNPISGTATVPTCSFAFTSSGAHIITAAFTSADTNFSSSTSANYTQTITAAATSVVVTSGLAPSTVNQPVTFSATVTASTSGSAIPQGAVTYTDTLNKTVLCSSLALASGVAPSCTAALPTAGTHTIVVTFAPSNSNFQPATSNALNQIVNPTATTAAVTASPSTSTVDQPVTLTATISPALAGTTNPTGKVTFSYVQAGTTIILCSTPQTVKTVGSTTSAVCTAPFPAASTYTVTALYTSGDSNFVGSTAAPVAQTVNASGTSVTVSAPTPSPSSVNQSISFTAVIAPTAVTDAGLTLPTGSVTFSDSVSGTLCTSVLAADGSVPPCKATLGTAGPHGISATYSGDANFTTSSSTTPFSQTVNKTATSISVASSTLVTVVTQAVTYTATVTPAFAGTAPTGPVTFSLTQGGASYSCIATAALPPGGAAPYTESCTISYPNTVSGTVAVTATYAGDANFGGSTSSPITQTVQNFSSSITPGQITLTQGSSTTANTNLTDPFSPTAINLTSTALNGFSDPVAVIACNVAPDASGNAIQGLSCAPQPSPTPATGVVVITATSAAPIGTYAVQLTIGDARVPTLTHIVAVSVSVINLATQATTPIVGTDTATFNLASPLPSGASLSIGSISIVNSNGTYTVIPMTEIGIQTSAITPVSGSPNSYSFTVTAGTAAAAQVATSRTVFAAAAMGVPLLFALSLLPGARRRRKTWLRYLGMVLLAIAAMHGVGCSSGGFTRASSTVGVVGSYVIQIESTQNGNTTTVAVVPLLIEQ
ncbi:Ig-like domain repeat protein [Acidicapsa acidisoli]|uniref:Ig-like domain repeat protein n=1 Tax=Acidicapsa acidisoli TaxID=1615681 RepID=UPI0021DF509F|nr:Ig-like domain repeat protein [Acidicapsa acidisoli]